MQPPLSELQLRAKRYNNLNPKHKALLKQVVPALIKARKDFKGTQQDFAKSLGVSRTTVSHLVNCLAIGTKNPEFRSVPELIRLKNHPELQKYLAPKQLNLPLAFEREQKRLVEADSVGRVMAHAVPSELKKLKKPKRTRKELIELRYQIRTQQLQLTKELREVKRQLTEIFKQESEQPRMPRVREVWTCDDKRRRKSVEITVVHRSKDPKKASVSYRDVRTGRSSTHRLSTFVERYSYHSASF